MNGETKTGVTTFLLDEHTDTGAILLQREVEISALEKPGTDELAVILIRNASNNISVEQTPEGVKTIFEI